MPASRRPSEGPETRKGAKLAVQKGPHYNADMKSWISERISIDPAVCHGKPVVSGTRIPVAQVVAAVASGQPWPEILQDYPGLTTDDLQACLEFAGALAGLETLHA